MTVQSVDSDAPQLTAAQEQFHCFDTGRLMMPGVFVHISDTVIDIEQAGVSFQPTRAADLNGANFEFLIVRIREDMSHLYIRIGKVTARVNRATINGSRHTSAVGVNEALGLPAGWKGRVVSVSSGSKSTKITVEEVTD